MTAQTAAGDALGADGNAFPLTVKLRREEAMRGKQLLRDLGLSLMAALGLLVFGVSSASAENLIPANHVRGGILVDGSQHLLATFSGAGGLSRLLVLNLGIEIDCTVTTLSEAKITNGLNGTAVAKVLIQNCKVYEWNGAALGAELPCFISNGGINRHITAKVILLVITHEGVLYVLAEPDTSEPLKTGQLLAEVKYESGTGCPIPLTTKITGSYVFEVSQVHDEVVTVTAGSHNLQLLFGDELKYGVNTATLHGSLTSSLMQGHTARVWGVI